MLRENVEMAAAVCAALKARPVAHVVYISSDSVYKDSSQPLTETSCAEPASLHGIMHLAREVALREAHPGPLALVRPTLVYGLDDPHNGYGPNRFRRLAAAGKDIVLFGEGEERRDHVDVEDIAELSA
jgi:nucleoside-diphosphate-sugar epimerase